MEIEEDMVVGFDLQKRQRSHMLSNMGDSEFSSINISLNHETTTTQDNNENGGNEEAINGDLDIHNHLGDYQNVNGGSMLYPTINEGTNGFSTDQNGADVAVSSPESNVADEEVHVRTNGTSFLQEPIGFKYVESLFDESSSGVNDKHVEALNKVDEILKSGENEASPEAAEYDVEGVIMKQETHDLFCPNCNSCITKRVILRRRKRKIQEISTAEEIISSDPGQIPTVDNQIVEPSSDVQDSAVGAVTCFSCFSIFIPTGKGFLFWKSASKPRIVHQQESSPDTTHQTESSISTEEAAADASNDEETGKSFPMWILTCCEPYKRERETTQQGESDKPIPHEPEPPMTPPLDSLHPQPANDDKPEVAAIPPVDSSDLRPTNDIHLIETSFSVTEEGKSFPSWILTCCQPSTNQTKEEQIRKTDTPVSSETESPGTHDTGTTVQSKHDAATTSLNPIRDITPGDTLSSSELKPTVTRDSEKSFHLWFLTCCQPDHKVEKTESPDKQLHSEPKVPGTPEADTLSFHESKLLGTPDAATALSPIPNRDITPSDNQSLLDAKSDIALDADKLLPSEPYIPGAPEADRPSPSYAKSDMNNTDKAVPNSDSEVQNQQAIHIPGKQINSKLTVIPPDVTESMPEVKVKLVVTPEERPNPNLAENSHDTHFTRAEQDLEAQPEPLLPSDEHRTHRVSGFDVIKAIVYGGLLETIASLSVISSAAGGDATTLNIVALGLANVFGGLIVLFHNLRDLKNNTHHYEEQLGIPGRFLLHATIAIISYLIFGLMAPVVYGFSFRNSDDKNFKLITLSAASLICIILLSIGKAYARRSSAKGYIKTILYYASIGVLVSGLGYVAGYFINDALKKLGVFDSESPVNMSVLETGAMKAALFSY